MPPIMKLTDVGCDQETVDRYIEDDNWIMQQKFDGTRVMAIFDSEEDSILWSNNGVKPVTHSAAKLKLPALEEFLLPKLRMTKGFGNRKIAIEGELLIRTGEYVVWDLLKLEEEDDTPIKEDWVSRHTHLNYLTSAGELSGFPLLKLSPTAVTPGSKSRLWERILASNVEGAVSKHRESLYVPGVRSKDWVKHKLVKTADLIVTSTARTFKDNGVVEKGNAGLAYYDPENEKLVGFTSASLIGKDLSIKEGDVVEVAYLYREPGGSIVQPRITRKRWDADCSSGDKDPRECTLDQFPEYSREVVSIHG